MKISSLYPVFPYKRVPYKRSLLCYYYYCCKTQHSCLICLCLHVASVPKRVSDVWWSGYRLLRGRHRAPRAVRRPGEK